MTSGGRDHDSGDKPMAQNQAGTGKTSRIRKLLRELYEEVDFDGTFIEWFRERSSTQPRDDSTRWTDPKGEVDDDSGYKAVSGGDE